MATQTLGLKIAVKYDVTPREWTPSGASAERIAHIVEVLIDEDHLTTLIVSSTKLEVTKHVPADVEGSVLVAEQKKLRDIATRAWNDVIGDGE